MKFNRIAYFLFVLLFFSYFNLNSQNEKLIRSSVEYLASDQLKGRYTSSKEELKAARYIASRFKKAGLIPYNGFTDYLIPFEWEDLEKTSRQFIRWKNLQWDESDSLFPLIYSNDQEVKGPVMYYGDVSIQEFTDDTEGNEARGDIVAINIDFFKNNPHVAGDLDAIKAARRVVEKGAIGIVFYTTRYKDEFKREYKAKSPAWGVPVFFAAFDLKKIVPENDTLLLHSEIKRTKKKSYNVAGFKNNGSDKTIIIGAHYDHLGMGGENSLHRGNPEIHNGADDNASGVAGMIYLAELLSKKQNSRFNYLFIAFSGEELGLLGSSSFVKQIEDKYKKQWFCMINFDMIGRLDKQSKKLAVYGTGTAGEWKTIIDKTNPGFQLNFHEDGVGPSDHTSFYLENLPVLHFFTGQHADYHKPTDDVDKLNIEGIKEISDWVAAIIDELEKNPVLTFQKTASGTSDKVRFKVTLGIIPDYVFSGKGVRIDGIIDDRPAQKAGLQKGDIILQLGEFEVIDMQTYMKALGKFEKGQTVDVVVDRNGNVFKTNVTF
ncbi:MAG: hypothetical protein KatS3mg034_1258 [Vicingaceae bacterium]|nr:MAG: hypothetical protein KatS3mg034_1258 [Vicingaceae bacterium]